MTIKELLRFIFDFLEDDMRITGAELHEKSITVYCMDEEGRENTREIIVK